MADREVTAEVEAVARAIEDAIETTDTTWEGVATVAIATLDSLRDREQPEGRRWTLKGAHDAAPFVRFGPPLVDGEEVEVREQPAGLRGDELDLIGLALRHPSLGQDKETADQRRLLLAKITRWREALAATPEGDGGA